jgi:hypothetical protein
VLRRSWGLEMFSELEELLRAACSNCPVGGTPVSGAFWLVDGWCRVPFPRQLWRYLGLQVCLSSGLQIGREGNTSAMSMLLPGSNGPVAL